MSDKIHFVSLGCPKNRVDSEVMLGVAENAGYQHTADPAEAEVIVVNTCGFIDPAKKESIDTILELADQKQSGRCRKLVVTGCLVQRHATELATELPEVDHFLGSSDMLAIADALAGTSERVHVGQPRDWLVAADSPRTLSTQQGSAYLKIAEGCNRSCSFCVIPRLRGKQRSRPLQDVVREAEQLVARGVREINLVSQDTIAYGRDLESRPSLTDLVGALAEVAGLRWLRIFYLYPDELDDGLVELLADHPRVVPYVDMPLQHVADPLLRLMKRGHRGARIRSIVERLRSRISDLTFRTAFIVGHPGESQAHIDELCDFVEWADFDRVGVFRYSDEDGTDSAALGDKISPLVTANRQRRLMAIARRISRRHGQDLVGRELEVLVEGGSDEHEHVLVGRHRGQAPEIDGQIFLSGTEHLARLPRPGEMVKVVVSQASDYDLVGEVSALEPLEPLRGQTAAPVQTSDRGRVSLRVLSSDNRVVPK